MKAILILNINAIILQVSFSDAIKNVEPYALVNIGDYFYPAYNQCVFGVDFYQSGNIMMHVYDYIKRLIICIQDGVNIFVNCEHKDSLDPHLLNNSDINLGRFSTKKYFFFQKQKGYIRIFNDNYECQPKLLVESPICFDFYNAYNQLKIKLKYNSQYQRYLNIQYFSNSSEGKIPSTIQLINKDTNKYIINTNSQSLNILQSIEPNNNYLFQFSPPSGQNIHSMYCLYYSYYDNFYSYVNVETNKIPLISPGKFRFFSTYDETKVNITSGRYNITYYFKLNNTQIIDCFAYHKNLKKNETIISNYSCSSFKTNDNIHYSISLIILKNFTYSYVEFDLYPNDLDYENYIGNFLEFNRTIENEEYLIDYLDDLIFYTIFVLIGFAAFFSLLVFLNYRCD